ncbi:MAG: hypothetical protein IPM47_03345 [Sphingobacteriales bacterium]|nr:MAG: hypothetical protein IPM47_03345 [Sphingobacteriales bacterium]
MKSSVKIIAILTLLGVATGFYFLNSTGKQVIDRYIIGVVIPPPATPIEPEKIIYVLADGTGSTKSPHNIPQVTIDWIEKVLDTMYVTSGGKFYISHVDNDSRNNEVLYISVPSQVLVPLKPERENGEISFEYSKRLRDWENSLDAVKKDSDKTAIQFKKAKVAFLADCSELLNNKVYVKSKNNLSTDIIGILNAAFITLQNNQNNEGKKYVVGFSDFIQAAPNINIKLNSSFEGVQIIAVNPVQNSSKKMVTDKLIQLEHPNRVIETIFTPIK